MNLKKRSPSFICFTGIDGSGKTTHSKNLVDFLNKRGITCKYVYGRQKPFLLKPFILIGERLFLHEKSISGNYSDYSETKRNAIENHPRLSELYQKILMLDCGMQILIKVKLPLILGKTIVCDRYIYDTIITDLSIDMNYSKEKIFDNLNFLFTIFPVPDITFLIDLPEETAFKRKNDTPSVKYLQERRKIYLNAGRKYNMIIIDGSKDLENLSNAIKRKVLEQVNLND